MKRILLVLLIVLVVAGTAGGFIWYRQSRDAAPRYRTETVSRGDLSAQIIATGTVNPVTIVQVGSQISGTILKLFADFNTVVKNGQVIAQIDPALFQAKVDQAKADLKNAQATVEREKATLLDNQRTLKRYQSLLAQDLIAQMDVDTAQTKVNQSQATLNSTLAQVETARANLASAQTNLNYCTIRSPVNGIVISRNVDVGQTVAASLQAPTLFTIAQDLREMEIHTNVDEADIGRVKLGQEARFSVDSFPGENFTGRVGQIRNAATTVQNVVTYDVVLEIENPDLKLKPGMTANVSIIVEEKENVLRVPNGALRFKPPAKGEKSRPESKKTRTGPVVWLLGPENKLKPAPVQTGINDGKYTEILQGALKEGDLVVVEALSAEGKKAASPPNQKSGGPTRGFRL
ncbi:MAG: efflux RND transporter periplasmic adaptor subunit [Deltaproteobacteria bacterium]|nr:efflux RND transporter periplasmic adaptor subunit [Deltaproteobacteria bacterium]